MWASAQRRFLASATYLEQRRNFSSFMLHADSRSQDQINVFEKKAGDKREKPQPCTAVWDQHSFREGNHDEKRKATLL
jgi:hypothetical protein